jgi:hypothetical protein
MATKKDARSQKPVKEEKPNHSAATHKRAGKAESPKRQKSGSGPSSSEWGPLNTGGTND